MLPTLPFIVRIPGRLARAFQEPVSSLLLESFSSVKLIIIIIIIIIIIVNQGLCRDLRAPLVVLAKLLSLSLVVTGDGRLSKHAHMYCTVAFYK